MRIAEIRNRPTRTQTPTHLDIPEMPRGGALDQGRPRNVTEPARTRSALRQAQISPEAVRMAAGMTNPGLRDEISDEEARRHAGPPREVHPEPPQRTTLPARIGHEVTVPGMDRLEWHAVKSVPGYMMELNRAILRQAFRTFHASIPLEDMHFVSPATNPPKDVMMLAKGISTNGRLIDESEVSLGHIVPGYTCQVKLYQVGDEAYMITKDIAGIAVFVWPQKDNLLPDNTARKALDHRS